MSRKPDKTIGNSIPWTSIPYKERSYSAEQTTALVRTLSTLLFLYVVTEALNVRKPKTIYVVD